jgi:mercuric ion binding protein
MKKTITLIVLFMGIVVFSQNKNEKAVLEVDGICGMCKVRIEKAAIKTKGVKSAVWSIETHKLKLIYDGRKTNLDSISKKIASVGHDTKKIKATEEAYQSVDPCCKYRDEDVVKAHDN